MIESALAITPVKILIVDDNEDNLLAFDALLRSDGLELLKARSGRDALELLLVHEIALALIDVQMPEMDGFELAQLMRGVERTRQLPIVFITAASRDQQRVFDGYSVGAVDFLFKPVEPHVIRSKVEVFVRLHRQKALLSEQLEQQREMLRLNELLSAAIGHDLRTPLNSIVVGAALILKQSTDERVRWAAQRIHESGARMTRLISDLLDFSRARISGVLPISPAPADLLEVSRRVIAEIQLADSLARIELESAGNVKGTWDEGRIGQALSNLISNALIHGDRSDPVVVRLDGEDRETVSLTVRNKGVIAATVLPNIFNPFRTTAERNSGSSGLGLGLFIVKEIVKIHSGSIDVSSDPSAGTSFTIRFPRCALVGQRQERRSIGA